MQLPRAVIARIAKEALPDGVNIGQEAKIAFGAAARVFISYITAA